MFRNQIRKGVLQQFPGRFVLFGGEDPQAPHGFAGKRPRIRALFARSRRSLLVGAATAASGLWLYWRGGGRAGRIGLWSGREGSNFFLQRGTPLLCH